MGVDRKTFRAVVSKLRAPTIGRCGRWPVIALLACGLNASAITINRDFIGGTAPGNAAGGGDLVALFNTAADWWVASIQDSFTLTIHYEWAPLGVGTLGQNSMLLESGSPSRQTQSYVAFDNDGSSSFFLDPTPLDNLEFGTFTATQQDLGGGSLNVGRVWTGAQGSAAGRWDLLSVAIHEIGHSLGLASSYSRFAAEAGDSDVDVTGSLPFSGSVIPLVSSADAHIKDIGSALMYPLYPSGTRRLPAAVDILANAQISGFTQVNLNPQIVPEPAALTLMFLGLAGVAAMRRRSGRKHP